MIFMWLCFCLCLLLFHCKNTGNAVLFAWLLEVEILWSVV